VDKRVLEVAGSTAWGERRTDDRQRRERSSAMSVLSARGGISYWGTGKKTGAGWAPERQSTVTTTTAAERRTTCFQCRLRSVIYLRDGSRRGGGAGGQPLPHAVRGL